MDANKIKYYPQYKMNSPQYTDSNNSVDEGLEDYKPNGYHPVHIGEILLERYIIMQKLGFGHFSTAWLALDSKYGNYVCIKNRRVMKDIFKLPMMKWKFYKNYQSIIMMKNG